MAILTGRRFPNAMPFRQWRGDETTVPTSFELLTATSAELGDFLNRNIKIKYSRSVQICPRRAVRPDIYCSGTWLCPLYFPSGESTFEPGLPARFFSKASSRPGKAQQHRQYIPRRVQIATRSELPPGADKEERCGSLAGSPQQYEIQLNFLTYVPELNICNRTRG